MRPERVDERFRGEPRGFDGLLGIHAEDEQVEDDLQIGLRLIVAAGTADRRDGHTVLADEIADERRARALARRERVRMAVLEIEHLAARAQRAAKLRRERRFPEHAAARRQRDHVALRVDRRDVRGAIRAARSGGGRVRGRRTRSLERRALALRARRPRTRPPPLRAAGGAHDIRQITGRRSFTHRCVRAEQLHALPAIRRR